VYVTEKATQRISRYALDRDGLVVGRSAVTSPGATPFGFALGLRGQLIVSEANGGAATASTLSSFSQQADGGLQVVTPSLGAGQTAACWVVATPDGRVAYASNTGDDTVSSFRVGFDGSLSVLDPAAASTGDGPLDMATNRDGRFFYVLNRNGGSIGSYGIDADGGLVPIPGQAGGFPSDSTTGLAVR
jgi:6-phosphogluconolactonase (cycloisomerase 2 family)